MELDLSKLTGISSGQVAIIYLIVQTLAGYLLSRNPIVDPAKATLLQKIAQFVAVDFPKLFPKLDGGTTPVPPVTPSPDVPPAPAPQPRDAIDNLLSFVAQLLKLREKFAEVGDVDAVKQIDALYPALVGTQDKAKK